MASRELEARAAYTIDDETALTFCGYLAFADPPNTDAGASLEALQRDGVQVKILTGDNELVARHVWKEVGLKEPKIILGEELESARPIRRCSTWRRRRIFSRVSRQCRNIASSMH